MEENTKVLVGYHGTTQKSMLSILKSGLIFSPSIEDWLGHGCYFFIDGISDAFKSASEWVNNKNPKEKNFVIKVKIELKANEILDLTTTEGLKFFNSYRESITKEFYEGLINRRDISIKKRKDIRVDDCIIMNIFEKKLKYKAIIHNVYIKNRIQRTLELESSYPNSTVLCIENTIGIEIIKAIEAC
ncbi:hypothetical protein [Pantoea ananatis]|uniref:hypothetical protein n=1 Tax=Pantoea ananas TaxID=553 RepID=UPI0030177085